MTISVGDCPHCERLFRKYDDHRYGDFCSWQCRRAYDTQQRLDAGTDWFRARLAQHVIRECWGRLEQAKRAGVDVEPAVLPHTWAD